VPDSVQRCTRLSRGARQTLYGVARQRLLPASTQREQEADLVGCSLPGLGVEAIKARQAPGVVEPGNLTRRFCSAVAGLAQGTVDLLTQGFGLRRERIVQLGNCMARASAWLTTIPCSRVNRHRRLGAYQLSPGCVATLAASSSRKAWAVAD